MASNPQDRPPRHPDFQSQDAYSNYAKAELETKWKSFVHRARIHEMLKCLESEHRRLQVLHDNVEFEDMVNIEYLKSGDGRKSSGREDGNASKSGSGANLNVLYQGKPEGKGSTEGLLPEKIKPEDVDHISRTKKRLKENVKNRQLMTDKEFEEIVKLCEDKTEQNALRLAFEEKKAREKYLKNADQRRIMLYDFICSDLFNRILLVTILVSTIGIFLMTFEAISVPRAYFLHMLDSCIMAVFMVEAISKITIYRGDYFKEPWNLLDLTIIIIHVMEVTVDLITKSMALSTDITDGFFFKFLKSLRALRLIRVIRFLPNLLVVVATLFQSMLSIGSIAVLMLLFMFVFAVIGRGVFYEVLPMEFGSIIKASLTLFTLLTLDDWFETLQDVEYAPNADRYLYWGMFFYLFAYITIEYFVFLNLFVAVLVDNFQLSLAEAEAEKRREQELEEAKEHIFDKLKLSFDETVDEEFWKSTMHQQGNAELPVWKYFSVPKDSKQAKLFSEIFKDFNSLDFERFMWKRRLTLINNIMDQGLSSQANTWSIQDADSITAKKPEGEQESKNDSHSHKS